VNKPKSGTGWNPFRGKHVAMRKGTQEQDPSSRVEFEVLESMARGHIGYSGCWRRS
jgi:hypothetical protein